VDQKRENSTSNVAVMPASTDRKCACGKEKMRSFEWCEKCTAKKAKANALLIKKWRE
jgi:hypothetical protein